MAGSSSLASRGCEGYPTFTLQETLSGASHRDEVDETGMRGAAFATAFHILANPVIGILRRKIRHTRAGYLSIY
jgi:hypothetical protein